MASPPRQQRKPPFWQRSRQPDRTSKGIPWAWLGITALLYVSMGMLLAAFPVPYWIWNLALGGVIFQALSLAGPRSLSRFRWFWANTLALIAIIGTALIAVALGIAMGFIGTSNLDEVEMSNTAAEVLKLSLLAFFLPAVGAIIGAETGDRLWRVLNRLQTTLVLAATCIFALGLGGLIGLAITE